MCWHRWTKWETERAFIGEYVFGGGTAVCVVQRRKCPKCGKVELNRQIACPATPSRTQGEELTDRERRLAILEEVAVLAVQKLRQHHRLGGE